MKISKWWWSVGAVIVVAVALSSFRACNLYDELSLQKGKYEAYRAVNEATKGAMAARLKQAGDRIKAQDEALAKLQEDAAEKDRAIQDKAAELARLRAAEPPAPPEVTNHPLVLNLRAQLLSLSEQFTLAQAAIRNRDEQIVILNDKLAVTARLAAEWRTAYEQERGLREIADGLIKGLEGRQRAIRLKSNLKTAALIGAAGIILYSNVKK